MTNLELLSTFCNPTLELTQLNALQEVLQSNGRLISSLPLNQLMLLTLDRLALDLIPSLSFMLETMLVLLIKLFHQFHVQVSSKSLILEMSDLWLPLDSLLELTTPLLLPLMDPLHPALTSPSMSSVEPNWDLSHLSQLLEFHKQALLLLDLLELLDQTLELLDQTLELLDQTLESLELLDQTLDLLPKLLEERPLLLSLLLSLLFFLLLLFSFLFKEDSILLKKFQ